MATQVSSFPSVFHQAHEERLALELAPRTLFSKGSEALSVTIDTVSLGRNSLSAGAILSCGAAVGKVATAIGSLVVAGGALAFLSGGTIIKSAASGIKQAYQHANWEGAAFGLGRVAIGGTYALTGAGMVVAQSAAFASSSAAVAAGTAMFTGAGIALYGAVGVYAGYGLAVNHMFRYQFNKHTSEYQSDPNRLVASLEWIRQQVKIGSVAELQKKWDQFSARTSEDCCRFAREQISLELLEKIEQGDSAAIAKGMLILQEVKRANGKQIAKNWLLMTLAAIGIAAMVLGILFASGPFAPLLFAIAAVLWLFIDSSKLHEKFCNFFCGKSQIPPPELPKQKVAPQLGMD